MACYEGIHGILAGLAKSTDHPRTDHPSSFSKRQASSDGKRVRISPICEKLRFPTRGSLESGMSCTHPEQFAWHSPCHRSFATFLKMTTSIVERGVLRLVLIFGNAPNDDCIRVESSSD